MPSPPRKMPTPSGHCTTSPITHCSATCTAIASSSSKCCPGPASPAQHLALVGIYRSWPNLAYFDASPEALLNAPAGVTLEVSPHYWRALGLLAGRYWYEKDQSLSRLSAHLQVFVPRLDPSVQRYVL